MNKLRELVNNHTLKTFVFEKQIPTMENDTKSRLVDKLTLIFPNGEILNLSSFCSVCLENSSIEIE